MQLTTIALATILISSVATAGSDTPTFANTKAMFQKLTSESEAHKEAGSRPAASALKPVKKSTATSRTPPSSPPTVSPVPAPTPPKPVEPTSPASLSGTKSDPRPKVKSYASGVAGLRERLEAVSGSTPAPEPPVKTHPLPSTKIAGAGEKPTLGPAKQSAATSRTGPTPSPKVSPARTPTASEPAAKPKSAPILLPVGRPLGSPEAYRRKGPCVAGLASKFEPATPPTSPKHTSPSKPSATPSAGGIPEDTYLMSFKDAIEQGKYLDAMKIVGKLSGEKSREPYGKYLASFKVSEILNMIKNFGEKIFQTESPKGEHEYIRLSSYSKAMLGLFLMHADAGKFRELLQELGSTNLCDVLMSSIKYGAGSSLEGFTRVFREISIIDKDQLSFALEIAAECIFRYDKPKFFDELVNKLQKESILKDKDLVNFAYNAAFVEACRHDNLILAATYWDLKDTEIFPWMYARAMQVSYDKTRSDNSVFRWLVGYASGSDLRIFLLENKGKGYYGEEILKLVEDLYSGVRYKPRAQRYMSF